MKREPLSGRSVMEPTGARSGIRDVTVMPDSVNVKQHNDAAGRTGFQHAKATPCGNETAQDSVEFVIIRTGKVPGILNGPIRPCRKTG